MDLVKVVHGLGTNPLNFPIMSSFTMMEIFDSYILWPSENIRTTLCLSFGQEKLFVIELFRSSTVRAPSKPALNYKLRILGPTFLVYVLKQPVILTSLDYKPH